MNPKVIVIDGKTYHNVDEMPADIRQKYEQAMRSLGDSNDNHIPDAFETVDIFGDKDKDSVPDILQDVYKKPYTFLWTSPRNLASTIRSGEKSCIDEKDRLTICLYLSLAYANENNRVL